MGASPLFIATFPGILLADICFAKVGAWKMVELLVCLCVGPLILNLGMTCPVFAVRVAFAIRPDFGDLDRRLSGISFYRFEEPCLLSDFWLTLSWIILEALRMLVRSLMALSGTACSMLACLPLACCPTLMFAADLINLRFNLALLVVIGSLFGRNIFPTGCVCLLFVVWACINYSGIMPCGLTLTVNFCRFFFWTILS